MPAPTVGGRLAAFTHALSCADLSPAVADQVKSRVLDALANAIEARGLPVPGIARAWLGGNRGQATVLAHAERVPAVDAAFINATLVNGGTHDDFLHKSHCGAVAIPAALAVAEEEGSTGGEFMAAIVAGYEAAARAYLGCPGMVPGFRATGVAGAIGAAAAAAKLQHQPADGVMHALGCAAMFASGFGEGFLTGTMDVKLNVGWASRSGVSAAMLARCGATAAPTAFEGESGYFQAFGGTAQHAERAVEGLGERLLIEDVIYKECPVCIFVQTPVHLARALAAERTLDPARIRAVRLLSPAGSYHNPGFRNFPPYLNPLQARISAPFCVAAALSGGQVESYAFYEAYADPAIAALANKVELLPPESGRGDEVVLEVDLDDACIVRRGVEMETLRPSLEKLAAKFLALGTDFLGDAAAHRVLDAAMRLERLPHLRALTDPLREAAGAGAGAYAAGERRIVVA